MFIFFYNNFSPFSLFQFLHLKLQWCYNRQCEPQGWHARWLIFVCTWLLAHSTNVELAIVHYDVGFSLMLITLFIKKWWWWSKLLMKFVIGHVVMPSIEYGGDVLITLSNKSCKKNDNFWLANNNNWPSLWIFN